MEGSIHTEEVEEPSSKPGGARDEPSFLTAESAYLHSGYPLRAQFPLQIALIHYRLSSY